MSSVALIAITLAALAVAALAVRTYVLVRRAHEVVDRVAEVVDTDIAGTAQAWRETARGVQQAAGKLERGLSSLASTADRLDRLAAKLDQEPLARLLVAPTLSKLSAWVAGVRRGLAKTHRQKPPGGRGVDFREDEGEPSD
jgi:hypothetical protein